MRAFLIVISALLMTVSTAAQDLLVKRNGEQIRVKVLKITNKKVEFVRQGSELPIYTLPVSEIDYIEYPMGERDTFDNSKSKKPAANQVDRWHGPLPSPIGKTPIQPIKQGNSEGIYSVGDIYDKDGIKGIVAVLYDSGKHGLVMSLDEACLPWSTLHRKKLKATGATSKYDGLENMKAIEKYITDNNLSWEDFPAFKWCHDKGEGWYLPSLNELWSAGTMYMGGSRTASDRKFRKNYNETIKAFGGQPVSNIMIYHSSTEDSDTRYAHYSHMNSEQPYTNSGYKADDLFVRAFHKF